MISNRVTQGAVGAVIEGHVQVVLGLEGVVELQDEGVVGLLQDLELGQSVPQLPLLDQLVLGKLLECDEPAGGLVLGQEHVPEAAAADLFVDFKVVKQHNF